MAFTLRIKKTGLFGNKTISLQEIVQNCGFKYGVYNDFYVLDEDQDRNGSCILYNPQHIGRGISFSNYGSEVEIRHNIPTTASEIADFIKLLAEIKRQYGKCEIRDNTACNICGKAFINAPNKVIKPCIKIGMLSTRADTIATTSCGMASIIGGKICGRLCASIVIRVTRP